MIIKSYSDIKTIFGLIGNDENSLTSSLGFLYAFCPDLLIKTLRRLGIKGVRRSTVEKADIRLQKYTKDFGITDIEIGLKGYFKIMIEAKIGLTMPSMEQCYKYFSRFEKDENKYLVVLQNPNLENLVNKYIKIEPKFNGILKGLYWHQIIEDAIPLLNKYNWASVESFLLRSFIEFAKEEYYMKSYTDEIWIVPASDKPLWEGGFSHFDIHTKIGKIYYRTDKANYWPLYIAFRKDGFDAIQRVENIVYNKPPIEYVPDLRKVNGSWAKEPHNIWELSDPIPIGKHIATGPGMYRRHVTCTFKDLFTYDSVADIEKHKTAV